MNSLKKVRFLSHLGARPSVTLFVLGALGSSLLSGFAYTPKNVVVATVSVGSLPSSLVVSPDNSLVYVGNEDSNSISGINAATNEVAFTISVSGEPFYLAITPDGTKLYATLLTSNAALEFSTVTRQLVQSYGTGSLPQSVAVSPNGHLVYVANYDGTITVINEGTLRPPINVGGNPICVAFTPDGKYAYVPNQGFPNPGYTVNVIEVATRTVSTISSGVPYPYGGVAVSPDGSKVYVTGISSSSNPVVAVIDTATNQITDTIVLRNSTRTYAGVPALTPDGKFLYIPVSSGRIAPHDDMVVMVRTATNKLGGNVVVGTDPQAVAIAPDANYAYVSNYLDATVSVVDITPK